MPLAAWSPPWSSWGSLAIVVGAMAASFAVGAGVSPFGSLTAASNRPAEDLRDADGTLPAGVAPVLLVAALVAVVVLLVLAVLRRDSAGGLVAASVLVVPPVSLLLPRPLAEIGQITSTHVALAAVPLAVAVIALVGARVAVVRDAVLAAVPRTLRRPAAGSVGAFLAVAVSAAVWFVVQAMPTLAWPNRVAGLVALVVLGAGVAISLWLRGLAGALLAGVTLVGVALAAPWWRLINGDTKPLVDGVLIAIVDLLAAYLLPAGRLTRDGPVGPAVPEHPVGRARRPRPDGHPRCPAAHSRRAIGRRGTAGHGRHGRRPVRCSSWPAR